MNDKQKRIAQIESGEMEQVEIGIYFYEGSYFNAFGERLRDDVLWMNDPSHDI